MREDAINWAAVKPVGKVVSKETLNHRGLIELVSGLDVYRDTPEAFRRAYDALGIDIINRVPLANAPPPTPEGESRPHGTLPYNYGSLGVYDTVMRHAYPCETPEDVWDLDVASLQYEDLLVPVPHPCNAHDIKAREKAVGETGLYYPMLYTTLFMWGVEVLGWEVFMMAAAMEPDRFLEHFLMPCAAKSKATVDEMAEASDSPFIFVHDDLANAMGPMFQPDWYDEYIFPHYPEIWGRAKERGKKIILVADGNMEAFLPQLIEAGVDGLMFENPATPVEAVIEHFGQSGRFMIGGIDTTRLTLGTPEEIYRMVLALGKEMEDCPGFAIASCGGLHSNIPMANLESYFDARVEIGATPGDWRTRYRG